MKARVEAILGALMLRQPDLVTSGQTIRDTYAILEGCYHSGGKVLVCGNGGSAADAEHIVGELMKGFLLRRPVPEADRAALERAVPGEWAPIAAALQRALPAISLCGHPSFATAFANDVAPDMVFAQQVYGYGRKGDVLLGISTSGDSRNVVNAVQAARAFDLRTIGLTGKKGGRLALLCDAVIRVPADETFKVQEYHLPVYHALCAMLEEEFFGQS